MLIPIDCLRNHRWRDDSSDDESTVGDLTHLTVGDLTHLTSQGTSSTSASAVQDRLWIVETKLNDVVSKLNDIESQFIEVETKFEEMERKMRITDLKCDRLEREQEALSQRVDDRLEETVKVQADAIIVLERSINILLSLHSMD